MKLTITEKQNGTKGLASMLDMEAAVLLHSGFWLLLLSMFQWGIGVLPILLMVALPVLMVFATRQKIFGKYLVFYALVLVSLMTLVAFRFFSNAFLELLNGAIDAINETSGFRFVPFHTEIEAGKESIYLYAAEAVLMILTSAIMAESAVKKRLWPVLLLTTVPVVLGLLLMLTPGVLWLALFLAALMLYVIHCFAGTNRSGLGETGILWQMLGSLLVFLLLFLALFYNYSGSNAVQNLRTRVANRVEEIRYAPETPADNLNEGNLNDAESLTFTGDTVFFVTMEQPTAAHFRDFVGSGFEKGKWQPLTEDAMTGTYLGLNEWLAQRNFYPTMQLSKLYEMDANRAGSSAKTQTVSVKNVGLSSKRLHLFYEAVPTEGLLQIAKPTEQDVLSTGWKGQREYSYTAYIPIYKDYGSEDLSLWAETLSNQEGYDYYEAVESLYASFVHDNYLEIDEAYRELVSETGAAALSGSRYQDIVYGVRKYLQDNFTYSETIEPLNDGADALSVFAAETHSGYDIHFATLAALMFREAGVPSRYMEGYYLSEKEASAYENASDVEMELTDSNAHAWVEIYVNKVGWVPIEVTPGFFSLTEEETPEFTVSSERVSKQSPRPYYDNAKLPDSNDNQPEEEQEKSHTWLKWLLGVAAIVVMMVAAWFGGKRYLENRIRAAGSDATRFGFRFLLWLLRRRGYPVDKEDPFALSSILGEEYAEYVYLVYQDTYSKEEEQLTETERTQCAEYVIRQWKNGEKFDSSNNQPQ